MLPVHIMLFALAIKGKEVKLMSKQQQKRHVNEAHLQQHVFTISGMDCSACALSLEKHLNNKKAVKQINVSFSTGKMNIIHEMTTDEIIKEVSKAGYTATLLTRTHKKIGLKQYYPVAISGIALLLAFIGANTIVPEAIVSILCAASIVIGGYKPARGAFYSIKNRSLDMNVLMTAAVIGAVLIGEWLEGATVVWLFALGNMLQNRSMEKTRQSISSLMDLTPAEAYVRVNEKVVKKQVEEVAIGEVCIVKAGSRIPLDGVVIAGESSVNQASITGESIPVDKQSGDAVYAGTLNEEGTLDIKVTKLASDSTLVKIIQLVEEAQEKRAPTEAFVDKFARVYTPIVFIVALLVMFIPPFFSLGTWYEWLYRGLELLVIACPCALVISTPVAIVSAIGNAARHGVLIKGGAFLEAAGAISAIAFDKTGTLTEGKPKVSSVIPLTTSKEELLSIARALEQYSTHPIARAIADYTEQLDHKEPTIEHFINLPGKGVSAQLNSQCYYAGNEKLFRELDIVLEPFVSQLKTMKQEGKSVVIIGTEKDILGLIAVSDSLRHSSAHVIKALEATGVEKIVMLTGDHEGTAEHIAKQIGIKHYQANLLPDKKMSAIKKLQAQGHNVAMIGDGVNDAPALATAELGIAMGGAGSDTAMDTADIVLMADSLDKLPHTVKLSRKALHIIKQNIWFSLIVKATALLLIFPNILTLWMAVISDTGAALIVILNSMRLLRFKGK